MKKNKVVFFDLRDTSFSSKPMTQEAAQEMVAQLRGLGIEANVRIATRREMYLDRVVKDC